MNLSTRKHLALLLASTLVATAPLAGEAAIKEQKGVETLKETSRGFSFAAKKAMPAVVSIKSTPNSSAKSNRLYQDDTFDNPYDELMRRFFGMPHGGLQRERPPMPSFGSGFLISADGYILTNNHVVLDASEILVSLSDETEHKAKLVGRDVDTDLAVVKIEGKDLPWLKLGNSESLEIGEWVIAIGHPQMFKSTLTVGVVSAKGRSSLHLNIIEGYIQTDAAINPGNSGGPLLNVDGEVVGVNTAIASNTGYHIGLGFAIPSNITKQVSEQLIQSGSVRRVVLGIQAQEMTKDLAEFKGLKTAEGFAIVQILKDSPADKGGLQLGDVILSIDNQPLKDFQALRSFLSLKKPGASVQVQVFRNGTKTSIPVTLEVDTLKVSSSMASKAFGIELENAKPQEGLESEGVRIKSVEANSPAFAAKVRPGADLLAINNAKVHSVAECKPLLEQALAKGKALLLLREGPITRFVVLDARS